MSSSGHQHKRTVALLLIVVTVFSIYFSFYTIKRYQKGYAHYFDLGIMHQTVYNTFQAIKTGQPARFLELSDPHDSTRQVKRMSIHNDIFLGLLAPFYFIHAGPETLLILQSVVAGMGAWFLFFITRELLKRHKHREIVSCTLACCYLLYPPLQRAVTYEFHAVTFAPTLILAMQYAWLRSYRKTAFILALLAATTKEQVGLSIGFWAILMLYREIRHSKALPNSMRHWKTALYELSAQIARQKILYLIFLSSILWSLVSFIIIIPAYHGSAHFASEYYAYLQDGLFSYITGMLRPVNGILFLKLCLPFAFFAFLSPMMLLAALPEWAVVMLSMNENMQNIYFHYHTVLIGFVALAASEGVAWVLARKKSSLITTLIVLTIVGSSLTASYFWSALPGAVDADLYPWRGENQYQNEIQFWQNQLNDDAIRVSTSGHLAPFFTGRRYFYDFSDKYPSAQYIVLDTYDVRTGYHNEYMAPAYQLLQKDWHYIRVYEHNGFEVYRRIDFTVSK